MGRNLTLCLTGSESALSAAGVKSFIDWVSRIGLNEKVSPVIWYSFVHEVDILNDAMQLIHFHDMYWSVIVIPDIHEKRHWIPGHQKRSSKASE